MTQLPQNLDEAIAQACNATHSALEDGLTRVQVELAFPELKIMPLAQQFVESFSEMGRELRIFFPDAGSAALARRDWGDVPYPMRGIGELKAAIQPEEKLFIFIEPSSVEVQQVEALCDEAGERPVIFLNPKLEDVATIGIGYAGRQLRDRFLNKLESCYYLRPMEGAALLRDYPASWQVWFEQEGAYKLVAEQPQKPVGEELDEILMRAQGKDPAADTSKPVRRSFLAGLQDFLRALSQ